MEQGERPPSTKSQIREQESLRRMSVMYKLDRYSKDRSIGKTSRPFGGAEHAIGYLKTIVDDTDVGDYLYKKGVEIKLTNDISIKAGEAYENYSSGFLQKGRNLIILYKDKRVMGGERRVVIGSDFKKGVGILKQAGFNLKGLEKKTPKGMVGRIKGAIQFNAEPIASRVKEAGRAAAAVGLAGAVLTGGVYASQHPEVIQEKAHKIGGLVETVDKSIAERYHELTDVRKEEPAPTPQVEQQGPNIGHKEFVVNRPVTPPNNESQKNIEQGFVYGEIIRTLQYDGKKNGYYFVDLSFDDVSDASHKVYRDAKGRPVSPMPRFGPELLFPQEAVNSDGSSSFVFIDAVDGPIRLSVSKADAQKIRDLAQRTIENANTSGSYPWVPNALLGIIPHVAGGEPFFTYLDVFDKRQVTIKKVDSSRALNDEVLTSIEQSRSKDRLGVSANPQTDHAQSLLKNITSLLKTATP